MLPDIWQTLPPPIILIPLVILLLPILSSAIIADSDSTTQREEYERNCNHKAWLILVQVCALQMLGKIQEQSLAKLKPMAKSLQRIPLAVHMHL